MFYETFFQGQMLGVGIKIIQTSPPELLTLKFGQIQTNYRIRNLFLSFGKLVCHCISKYNFYTWLTLIHTSIQKPRCKSYLKVQNLFALWTYFSFFRNGSVYTFFLQNSCPGSRKTLNKKSLA